MYKNRITQWGLDKKHKEDEMRAIVRKNKERADRGKESVFFVRGRAVEHQEIVGYFKRKRLTIEDVLSQRQERLTPEAVECRTPSPRTIATPDLFAIPERIFRSIYDYNRGSFENGTWLIPGQDYHCYSSKARGRERSDLHRLYRELPIAYQFFKRGDAREAGQILISATASMKNVLLAEDPLLLGAILAIILELDTGSRRELRIGLTILKCLSSLGEVVLGREHPVVKIFGWLTVVPTFQLHSVATKASESVADHFSSILGPRHRTTLHVRLGFFGSVDLCDDLDRKTHQLRDLLQEHRRTLGFDDQRLMDVRWILAEHLIATKDYQKAEQLSRDMLNYARHSEFNFQHPRTRSDRMYSESLYIMACSQWGQQDKVSAKFRMEDAIGQRSHDFSRHDGRARLWMMQLEDWLIEMEDLASAANVRERRQAVLTSWRNEEEITTLGKLESRE